MQVSDMRTLRTLYAQHLRNLIAQSSPPSSHTLISCKSSPSQNPCFFQRKTFYSTSNRLANGSSTEPEVPKGCTTSTSWDTHTDSRTETNPSVSPIYDPVSGRLVARRATKSTSNDVPETESCNGDESSKERTYGGVRRESAASGSEKGLGFGDFVGNRKKRKSKTAWVCSRCWNSDVQWWGTCQHCKSVGTLMKVAVYDGGKTSGYEVSEKVVRSWLPQQQLGELVPLRLTDVNRGINQTDWRIPLVGPFGTEVARVLGGGLVLGSLVLVGGDPGVGKSTLLLQIAGMIAEGHTFDKPAPVVYVSGEESVEQIGNKADRMRIGTEELYLYSSTDIEDILEKIQPLSPRALIVDSIQTVYLRGVTGSAGGLPQVKECTSALLRFAKKTSIPVLLAYTLPHEPSPSPSLSLPRHVHHNPHSTTTRRHILILLHQPLSIIVYSLLGFELNHYFCVFQNDMERSIHLIAYFDPVKNRFGSTDEVWASGACAYLGMGPVNPLMLERHCCQLGVFEMAQSGLQAVSNPSEMFLSEQPSDSDPLAGLAVAAIIYGSRTFLIEIQAGIRYYYGKVLKKQAGVKLQNNVIYLNVFSGVTLTETSGDLAIAAAICSRHVFCYLLHLYALQNNFLEFPIPNSVAFIGEIGLGGELRPVPRMEKRVNTVTKLGYKKCIVPKSSEKSLAALGVEGTTIVGCRNLKDMINTVFTKA
ncbi:DNA repair protein RadA-like protein [Actinidia rufa]|uniref:DNA repair protein RadA-like protein n=1 Tax=Actinidia rufa TaxID=165716 RepID=A0A7J0FZV6_9ERIC|nr:DNA repair protein RadA-like protein [Actinidia rufa]